MGVAAQLIEGDDFGMTGAEPGEEVVGGGAVLALGFGGEGVKEVENRERAEENQEGGL